MMSGYCTVVQYLSLWLHTIIEQHFAKDITLKALPDINLCDAKSNGIMWHSNSVLSAPLMHCTPLHLAALFKVYANP